MARPQRIDFLTETKLLSKIMRSALSFATSHPVPIHKPTLAILRTLASEIELPAIPISPPCYWIPLISNSLSSYVALAMIFTFFLIALNSRSFSNSIKTSPVSWSYTLVYLPTASRNYSPVIAVPSRPISYWLIIPDLNAITLQVSKWSPDTSLTLITVSV